MDNKKMYENIGEELIDVLPDAWEKVIFYGEIQEASYEFEYYVKLEGKNGYIKCFDLVNISTSFMLKTFKNIYSLLRNERNKLSKEKLWSNCTFILKRDGEFAMNYDYSDLTDGNYFYKALWKYKYLGETPSPENEELLKYVEEYKKNN